MDDRPTMPPSSRVPRPLSVLAAAVGLIVLAAGWFAIVGFVALLVMLFPGPGPDLEGIAFGLVPPVVALFVARGLFVRSQLAHAVGTIATGAFAAWLAAVVVSWLVRGEHVDALTVAVFVVVVAIAACLVASWRHFWQPEHPRF